MELVIRLKGGSGSGNFGHAGRPGEVGGSQSGGDPVSHESWGYVHTIIQNLESHAFNTHRRKLVDSLVEEFSQAYDTYGMKEGDILEITLFGSFASSKEYPGDIDLLVRVREDFDIPGGGMMDSIVWKQNDHTAPWFVAKGVLYPMLQKQFGLGMKERGYDAKPVRIY